MTFAYPWTYTSRRSAVMAPTGMVATSHPLAATVGYDVLRDGGTAADAAVATAAMLSLVEPHNTGIGGDAFALTQFDGRYEALNGSGGAPAAATVERYRQRLPDAEDETTPSVPRRGGLSVTVPGALDAWQRLLDRYGTHSLARALAPTIEYARSGVVVTESVARRWRHLTELVGGFPHSECYLRDGEPLGPGAHHRNPPLAETYAAIAEEGVDRLYGGQLGREVVETVRADGGLLTLSDLEAHRGEWTDPIGTTYRGIDVLEHPPNGQGAVALEALNVVESVDLPSDVADPDRLHTLIEALKLAFADGDAYLTDPRSTEIPLEPMLSKAYAAERANEIGPRAGAYGPRAAGWGDTVYVAVVDADGNAVSLINSLFYGFGSGLVVGGAALQNRASGFSLDPDHANCLEPGKRPFHTIVPAMLREDGAFRATFGVCGGAMQPQAQVQLLTAMLDAGYNPQAALDLPRFRILSTDEVAVETARLPPETVAALRDRGHDVVDEETYFHERGRDWGSGQIVYRTDEGLVGGTDPRRDGHVVGY
ncbi:gamma-glutamyltransferase family protein [Salinirubellus salinus]|uniref:Gamma-glutamyltransferase family protein n=1 Tax=Salinirubellus salinus TaxID=1364945 RepID=A0A9E7R2W5_9EURY|nr:gamma-glutamyltransferase family protein [Salinirubellus salinus]UWM54463.1 gamma-glutamyltransferase family protein [Salinirubellus salinus]